MLEEKKYFLENLQHQIKIIQNQHMKEAIEHQLSIKESNKKLENVQMRDTFKILVKEYESHL
jgi:hypothetical protein